MKNFLILLSLILVPLTKCRAAVPEDLSIEEKIGQLLIVHFHGIQANEQAEELLTKAYVGGFMYYAWSNSLENFEQVRNLSSSLKKMNAQHSEIPLFLVTDQEGGRISRLKLGFSQFPSSRSIAKLDIPSLAFETATAQAKELKAAGLNMNFAPVIDIDNNSLDSVIGDRSFSTDPNKVLAFARQALMGYKEQNILASLKHFPGHGDVAVDSHNSTPIVNKPYEVLREMEWLPFMKLCHEADAIMTAHVLFPHIDPLKPASVSLELITNLLRNTWGYSGLVISDSLVMKGLIKSEGSVEQAALNALLAGTDILCLGGKLLNEPSQDELTTEDVLRIHSYLVEAVKSGKISESSINKSLNRIILAKERYCKTTPFEPSYLSENEKLTHSLLTKEIQVLIKINESPNDLCKKIAEKVWENETGSSLDKLLFWNPNEDFLSLGIGHFIWYPKNRKTSFEEGFPAYLNFLQNQKIEIPYWLAALQCCPWQTREDFLSAKDSSQVRELTQWLADTMDMQGRFLLHKLPIVLHAILNRCESAEEKQKMLNSIESLSSTPSGLYALVDYLNFKGSGLSAGEKYKGLGWGLLQVLEQLSNEGPNITSANFANIASLLLQKRTDNAPEPEKEKRWLKGWLKRVDTYRLLQIS